MTHRSVIYQVSNGEKLHFEKPEEATEDAATEHAAGRTISS
jgi:hypothetical protein